MHDREDRMPTGIPGLDHLLDGGIVRGNSLLVEGPPGSGKTTFAVRTVYEGARRFREPGLILTFEEFPKQLYQEAAAYGVDLAAMEQEGLLRVVWTPPERILEGFSGRNSLMDEIVRDLGVRRLAIDSITHFKRVAASEKELRETLAEILNWLKIRGINAFLVKELERMDDATIAFEEYLVDASMRVYNAPSGGGSENRRTVEIRKTRGQPHISGRHPFEMTEDGLRVYPRLRPVDVGSQTTSARLRDRCPSGVDGVDSMLHGGLWRGTMNLVNGYQGAGKSVLAHHFVDAGLQAGESALICQFHRDREGILAEAASVGMDWNGAVQDGRLRILTFDRVGSFLEKALGDIYREVQQNAPDRFVLENVNDLTGMCANHDVLDTLLALRAMLDAVGSTSLLVCQAHDMQGNTEHKSDLPVLANTVLQFSIAESQGQLRRYIGIRKHAASDHAKHLREINIDGEGLHVRITGGHSGVLTGQVRPTSEETVEESLPRIQTVLEAISRAIDLTPTAARQSLLDARAELATADVMLREHFGLTEFRKLAVEKASRPDPAPDRREEEPIELL